MPQLAPLRWVLIPILLWFILIRLFTFGHYIKLLYYPRQKYNWSRVYIQPDKWVWRKSNNK